MKIEDAIEIIKELTNGLNENGYVKQANNLAIQALEKQIPKKPTIEVWDPAICPCCGDELSESIGDGYYKHWVTLKFCDCGQALDWGELK